jgi:transposase
MQREAIFMASIVYQHHSNGTTYAYQQTSYWDKDIQRPRTKMFCIGKLDPLTKEIIYNKKFSSDQAKALVKDNVRISTNMIIGPAILLEKITKDLKLGKVLRFCFEKKDADNLLSIAWYMASNTDARLYLAEGWMEGHSCPSHKNPLTSPEISHLLRSVSRDNILLFMKKWLATRVERDYLCFDISSVSSYGENNPFIEWGYNRDKESLPQVNIALLSGMESNIPFYYQILPGSLHDSKALCTMNETLKKLEIKGIVNFAMDKGFYSKNNINYMLKNDLRFMIPVPSKLSKFKQLVDKFRDSLEMPQNIIESDDYENVIYSQTHTTTIDKKKVYYHVYMDTSKRIEFVRKFMLHIKQLYKELVENTLVRKHQKDYDTFFIVKQTPKRGRKITCKMDVVKMYRDKYVGYWAIITNNEKDASKALSFYRRRDVVEKHFDNMKNGLDMNRLRVQKPVAMETRTFIQFLALAIDERIIKILRETTIDTPKGNTKTWNTRYTGPEIFNKLESYTEVKFEGKYNPVRPKRTKAQDEIFGIFELND